MTSFLIVASIILLIFVIFYQKKVSNIQAESDNYKLVTNLQANSVKIDNTFQNVKKIMDSSLIRDGLIYFKHQEISTPGNHFNTISFIYFKSNTDHSPNINEIEDASTKSENLKIKGKSLMLNAQKIDDNEMAQEAARMMVEADRLESQEDRFYTFEIGKDTNMPPIVMVQPGLPEWIIMENKTVKLAEAYFKDQAKIIDVQRTTIGAPCIYTVVNSKMDSIYIEARSGKVLKKNLLPIKNQAISKSSLFIKNDRSERIISQWQEFMKNGIKIEDFNLKGLIDLNKQPKN